MANPNKRTDCKGDNCNEGRDDYFMDIDRMVNEGLGGGQVTMHNGLIEDSTTDTMDLERQNPDSVSIED